MSPTHRPPAGPTLLIIGAGQAGSQAAVTLREQGHQGPIVLLGNEAHAPYMRPPLSKKFLSGGLEQARLFFRPPGFYAEQGIELQVNVEVASIDRQASCVILEDGRRLHYDRLLLATGSRPRQLPLPGVDHADVLYLRGLNDAIRLRQQLGRARSLAIIGGGYIGLEVAATAAQAGLQVTVLERAGRLLERVTTAVVSSHVEQVHREHGVDVRCNVQVSGLIFDGPRLRAVQTDQGEVPADLLLVGIGSLPNDDLARAAGLNCNDGICVDASCRTSDPFIFAAGDCTRHPNALYGRQLRLESVQNAVDQASVAAVNMAGGQAVYARVPWFWSHQFGLKMQSAGLFEGYDQIVECGDRCSHRFALKYLRDGQLVGIDAINMPAEYLAARKTIAARGEIAPVPLTGHIPGPVPEAAPTQPSTTTNP